MVTRCHSLSLVALLNVIPYHSLSLFVICCHSLSFVVTRCTIRCHSFSLDVPLVCLFINDPNFMSIKIFFIKKTIDQIRFVFLSTRTCAHHDLKGNLKYHTFSTVKGTSPLTLWVYFCIRNNFAELQLLPMSEFIF